MAGNPTNLQDIIDVNASFIPQGTAGAFSFSGLLVVAEFTNPNFTDRVKSYTGDLPTKQQLLINDGFAVTSATYRQVTSMGQQKGPPKTINVGRKDAGDADWPAALDAIKVQANTDGISYYGVACDTRDVFDIEDIDAWTVNEFVLYIAQTDNAAVFNNTAGNVAELILAKNHTRTAMFWHDPAAASKLGPAVLTSAAGTFNVPNASDLLLRVDGGVEQPFDFDSTPALILGSIAGTYVFADGDVLSLALDQGGTQSIVFATSSAFALSVAVETFNIVAGTQLNTRVDGLGVEVTTFAGVAGAVATGAAGAGFVLTDLETVTFDIDGAGSQIVTFNAADFANIALATPAELTLVYAAQLTGVAVTDDGSIVTITSARTGSSTDVEIVAGDAGALAALTYAVGNNAGSGFALFLDVATATEVSTQINADTTNLTASAPVGGAVLLTADSLGTDSRIQALGGAANDVLLFDTNEQKGAGDFADATAATAQEVVTKLSNQVNGASSLVVTNKVQITSRTRGTGSKVQIFASTVATTLGLAVSTVEGDGDFFNASQATPSEIANHIALTLTGAVASSASSAVILTSATSGTDSELQITGGSLQSVLFFTDVSGNADRARGVGTDEDYLDCALLGRCMTADLDAKDGQITWDNHHLEGVFADRGITGPQRDVLQNTLQVLTYENRNGRDETHNGTLINNQLAGGRYIDITTTLDWWKARTVEAFKNILDTLADQKKKNPYRNVEPFDQALRALAARAQLNGHTFADTSVLDRDDPESKGIFTPLVTGQKQINITNRNIDGFAIRQEVQSATHKAQVVTIELVSPTGI